MRSNVAGVYRAGPGDLRISAHQAPFGGTWWRCLRDGICVGASCSPPALSVSDAVTRKQVQEGTFLTCRHPQILQHRGFSPSWGASSACHGTGLHIGGPGSPGSITVPPSARDKPCPGMCVPLPSSPRSLLSLSLFLSRELRLARSPFLSLLVTDSLVH